MASGVWKVVYPFVVGRSRHLSLNKFFNLNTPSLRMVITEETGKKTGEKKITLKIVATSVVASRPPNGDRLQRRPLMPRMVKIVVR